MRDPYEPAARERGVVTLNRLRYTVGETPNRRSNARQNTSSLPYPTELATEAMLARRADSRLHASPKRSSSTNDPGVAPNSCLNARLK